MGMHREDRCLRLVSDVQCYLVHVLLDRQSARHAANLPEHQPRMRSRLSPELVVVTLGLPDVANCSPTPVVMDPLRSSMHRLKRFHPGPALLRLWGSLCVWVAGLSWCPGDSPHHAGASWLELCVDFMLNGGGPALVAALGRRGQLPLSPHMPFKAVVHGFATQVRRIASLGSLPASHRHLFRAARCSSLRCAGFSELLPGIAGCPAWGGARRAAVLAYLLGRHGCRQPVTSASLAAADVTVPVTRVRWARLAFPRAMTRPLPIFMPPPDHEESPSRGPPAPETATGDQPPEQQPYCFCVRGAVGRS